MTTQPTASPPRPVMAGKPVITVPSGTVLNLTSGFGHKLLASPWNAQGHGLTFSLGLACVYSCTFCYVPDMHRKLRPWLEPYLLAAGLPADTPLEDVVIRREHSLDLLRRQLAAPRARALAGLPLVIYSSPDVDVAANMELVRETVEACQLILSETHWHTRRSTNSYSYRLEAQLQEAAS